MYKLMISKMSCLILIGILFSSQLSIAGTAQSIWEVTLDLELDDEPLTKAFEEIEAKTDFTFNYSKSDVKAIKLTNQYKDVSLGQILTDFSKKGKLKFRQIGQHINVNKLPVETNPTPIEVVEIAPIEIKVTDESGEPLVGVTVEGLASSTTSPKEIAFSAKSACGGVPLLVIRESKGLALVLGEERAMRSQIAFLVSSKGSVGGLGFFGFLI